MTVKWLIERLQSLPDQDAEVRVNVRTQTTRYPIAHVTPWDVTQAYTGATIEITLPDGMYIAKRKES